MAATDTATALVAVSNVATATVAEATAVVVDKTAIVAVATQAVTTAQVTITTAQEAQPALDAAASCIPGSACVGFYTKNAELGPLHDQIAPTQAAADAAVTAAIVAQTTVDAAVTTVEIKETALTAALDTATQAQAAADASSITTTTNGVKATVYYGTGRTPAIPTANTTPILTTTVPQIAFNWGNGSVMGGPGDRVIVKFEGTITVPDEAVAVKYAVSSDDGSLMYIDGQLAISNWRDQGTTWSQYSPTYSTTIDKQQDFVIWYYENSGGATCTLGWAIWRADGTGYFTTPGASAFAATVVTKDPTLVANFISADTAVTTVKQELTTAKTSLANANQTLTAAQAAVPIKAQIAADAQAAYDAKVVDRNATYEAWQTAMHAANYGTAIIAQAQAAYDQAQVDLFTAKENLVTAQRNLTVAVTAAGDAASAANAALNTANQLADVAIAKANEAKTALETATTTVSIAATLYTAEQIRLQAQKDAEAAAQLAAQQAAAAAYVPPAPPVAEPEPLPTPVEQPAPEPEPSPEPSPEVVPAPQPNPDPAPVVEPEPQPEPQPIPEPVPAPEPAPEPAPAPAPTLEPAPAPVPASLPPVVPGLIPNSPDQLSDTTPKEAPKEVLVPHIQVDKPGVENGGIEFFGTKSAPQVVGEDGTLTPPAPPPGSGLPIPPDAITTQDTFIGQPGGTTFNAPDIAVPVELVPVDVPAALDVIPGAGAAVQAVNQAYVALANIGNDMSPITRKKAKKILVITTVIAAVRRRFGS